MRDRYTPAQLADDIAAGVAAVLADLAHPPTEHGPPATSLEYERWVERPRRQGIDPVWQALLAEALGDNPQPVHRRSA